MPAGQKDVIELRCEPLEIVRLAIIELSEKSVEYQSTPVVVPDFTRGTWKKVDQVTYYHAE